MVDRLVARTVPAARASAAVIGALSLAALLLGGCASAAARSTGDAGNAVVTIESPAAPGTSGAGAPANGTVLDLPVPAALQDLALTDQDGRSLTLASLLGRTVVISPSLTLCQETCPLISANFGQSVQAVAKAGLADQVVFLEVTVDPGRDDVAHLKAYQKLFGVHPNWDFLTGSATQIAAFWDGLHLGYEKAPDDPGPAPHDWLTGKVMTYDVHHQNVVYVLGPDGHVKWLVDSAPNVKGGQLPDTLRRFLNDEGVKNYSADDSQDWTSADVDAAVAYVSGHPVPS